jgi:hypothetical protein
MTNSPTPPSSFSTLFEGMVAAAQADASAKAARAAALPMVEFTSARVLQDLESANGQKCESWGVQFRVITEAHFQLHCLAAMKHGANGGMIPNEW